MEELEVAAKVDENQPTSPVDTTNQTKAFSERLKVERAKIAREERENVVKELGFESYEAYVSSKTDSKLLDNGLDPEHVRPVLKELMRNDPEYVEAMNWKKEKEALEAQIWSKNELEALNNKYGFAYKSVDELDPDTIEDWNKGMKLEKAFAANNIDKIQELAIKKASKTQQTGKEHLNLAPGGTPQETIKVLTTKELETFRRTVPNATEEQINAFINRNK